MTGDAVGREEVLDALEESAGSSLELYRSFVASVTLDGEIDEFGAKEVAEEWKANLKRWYSVLRRSGRGIGDIPELGRIEP